MSNPFSYENKRVVVTGGATGVGAGLLEVLAEQDAAHVTVLDLKEPSGPAHDVPADATSPTRSRSTPPSPPSTVRSTCCSTTPASPTRMPPATVISGELPRAARAVGGPAAEDPRRWRDREHRLDRGRPVADAARHDQRGARPRWQLGVDPRVARLARPRYAAVRLLQGAGAGVHDALVAPDAAARRAHQQRVPGADRHARCSRTSARR